MFGMGSKTIVGLDVGSSSIKAVELRRTRTGIEVAHLGLEPIAPDIVVDSMIVDSGTVSSAIAKLFADTQIKSKAVATAVSGHSVIVKKISLPSMSDQELAETIQKEAAQHIPFDLADVNLDYQILSDDASSPQMDVLLVAVKKDKILNYTNVLSMAGKTPAIVDIDALALQNCYEFNYEPAPTQVVALLNLGASVMNINIVKGTTPLFPRDVSVGGHQYTDSLQKELDLSFDDAESLKLGRKVGTMHDLSLTHLTLPTTSRV
jgi:type IV pilus assembly protein PilM